MIKIITATLLTLSLFVGACNLVNTVTNNDLEKTSGNAQTADGGDDEASDGGDAGDAGTLKDQ